MRRMLIVTVVAIMVVTSVIVFAFDPAGNQWYPKCPVRSVTGFSCPGCGTGRAMHQLLNLHFAEAFMLNPVLAIALPYIALLLYLEYGGGKKRFSRLYAALTGIKAIYATLIIIMAYTLVRNIYGF